MLIWIFGFGYRTGNVIIVSAAVVVVGVGVRFWGVSSENWHRNRHEMMMMICKYGVPVAGWIGKWL
jgi:hypothetical protein